MMNEITSSPVSAIASVLELTAALHPELLDFQLELVLDSHMRFAARQLATEFGVTIEQLGPTIYRACLDLDRLEKRQRWRDPSQVVQSPNVAALHRVCEVRTLRISGITRRRWLGVILRRLQTAHDLARSRARIEAFIEATPGPASRGPEQRPRRHRDPRGWIEELLAEPNPADGGRIDE